MKTLNSLFSAALCLLFMLSCEKEYSFETGSGATGIGTLKSDVLGDCLPSSVSGIYKADSTLGTGNFIEVQVEVTTPGSYLITSDTINGYSFKGTGTFTTVGLNSIKLQGIGRPLNAGRNDFLISLNGSECFISVTVIGASASIGSFTLGGAPGICTGASASGTYTQGVALTSSNTLSVNVNVTAPGAYALTASSANGMTFNGAGTFTTLGAQIVTLVGSGTPSSSGPTAVTLSHSTGNCSFSLPVVAGTGTTAAVYTLGGAGATCTGVVLNGTYQAGLAMTASNTATINVNVTTIGTYMIASATVNGVTFSKSGSFTATGPQTVILNASGTGTTAGSVDYPTTGNASTCSFPVTFATAAAPAVFSLQGAPGVCTPAVVAGTYAAGTPLTASGNTVTIEANVTTVGSYSITTAAVNGMIFSASGTFTGTGAQPIVLRGTGTPLAAGTNSFTSGAGSTCTFSIVVGGAATDFIRATINGTAATFNENIVAIYDNTAGSLLNISGETTAGTNPAFSFLIGRATGGNISAGTTYTVNQITSGIILSVMYADAASVDYSMQSAVTPQNPGFSVTITTLTASRVSGSFSGTVKSDTGVQVAITGGTFSVPL